ncbi:Amino acid transporters [Phaffia rhodozyma]|uniref:Amino acid transporters n=1 Tax=Phaffia rhodozyma TaxID=264483 RepID=A0A0F7SK00_PHARH|nr:Amino acid transporters [Phaffia rhodozyma]
MPSQSLETTPLLQNQNATTVHARSNKKHSQPNAHADESAFDLRAREDLEVLALGLGETHGGKSTFLQALFNVIGDLVGTGLLASPLAIAYCGWVLGPILLILLAFITHRTLLVMVQFTLDDPTVYTYPDIVGKAFDKRFNVRPWLTGLFVFEIFAWTIALVILYSDTLSALLPFFSSTEWKIVSFFIIAPLSFMPLHFLSYTSFLGITTSFILIAIVLLNGFMATSSPGSILHPEPTDIWPAWGLAKVGVAGGLMMSAYGGHAACPVIVSDMKDTTKWRKLVDLSYAVALSVCLGIGSAGYLMFGRDVSDEISLDISKIPGFSSLISTMALYSVPIGMKMLNDMVEIAFNIMPKPNPALSAQQTPSSTRPPSPTLQKSYASVAAGSTGDDDETVINAEAEAQEEDIVTQVKAWRRAEIRKAWIRGISKISLVISIVIISITFPSFELLLAFMGSAPAFLVSVIIPLAAKKVYLYDHVPAEPTSMTTSVSSLVSSAPGELSEESRIRLEEARKRVNWSVEGWFDWSLIVFGVFGAALGAWGTFV